MSFFSAKNIVVLKHTFTEKSVDSPCFECVMCNVVLYVLCIHCPPSISLRNEIEGPGGGLVGIQ